MKQVISLMMGCLITTIALSQLSLPVLKGYAWHQSTIGGVKPSAIAGENGAVNNKTLLTGKLFIYLEHKNAQHIVPYRIWIDGKPHRVQVSPAQTVPVVNRYDDLGTMKTDTLVPSTRNPVMQVAALAPVTKLTIPTAEGVSKDARPGTIVVEYYWKARRYAFTISEIKILEAVRLQ